MCVGWGLLQGAGGRVCGFDVFISTWMQVDRSRFGSFAAPKFTHPNPKLPVLRFFPCATGTLSHHTGLMLLVSPTLLALPSVALRFNII